MAHEIRTPLHQIVGFIELLGEPGALQKNDALDHVGMLESSALALMAIINDLLDFTKLEAGKMKLETIPFEVRGVLEGCVAAVGHQAVEEKGLQVTCDIEQAIPVKLMGDPNRLRQVILNMLTNAVKFTQTYNALNGNPGDIQIRASRKTDDTSRRVVVHFSVKDTGIGMSKHHCARIFNAYQQADASVARNYGGTGLGLAICKSLVEIMGGQIGVESKLGFGTTFWFEIPLQKHVISNRYSRSTPFLANAAAESEGEDDIVSGLRILVAEDNKVNQKVISKMLTRIGHVPVIVPDGQAAVDEIMKTVLALSALSLEESSPEQQKPAYDLVLMDWQMPIMDGIDATKEIRNRGYSMADLPIVGLTASIQNLDWSSVGMNDCLMKPVRIADLKESIHKNFTSASLRREIESRKNMPSDDILEKPPTPT
jgi:CheY-like chemotaxis protein